MNDDPTPKPPETSEEMMARYWAKYLPAEDACRYCDSPTHPSRACPAIQQEKRA